ncbi:hypothetical protein BH11ACT8_BH11ACT8_25280 [soil metagenome]
MILRRAAIALGSVAVVMAMAGCGGSSSVADDPESTPSETPSSDATSEVTSAPATEPADSALPACTDVWVADAKLPSSYQGCFDGTADVKVDRLRCSSGQTIVSYDDTYWAVPGAQVHQTAGLSKDSEFKDAKQSCLA